MSEQSYYLKKKNKNKNNNNGIKTNTLLLPQRLIIRKNGVLHGAFVSWLKCFAWEAVLFVFVPKT